MKEPCPECGIPTYIGSQHRWLNNGDIINTGKPDERITFMEFGFFDPLVREVERVIGSSIEHIVSSTVQAAIRMYVESLLPPGVGDMIREGTLSLRNLDDGLAEIAKLNGYGIFRYYDMRFEQDEDDYYTVDLIHPYSLYVCTATHGAAMEAMLGYDHEVAYEPVGDDVYRVTARPRPRPEELKRRLAPRTYSHADGPLELEKCATCGVPRPLAGLNWNVEEGIITSPSTGKRLSTTGPNQIQPVLDELEKELGEEIPRLVVDAQRRYAREGFFPDDTFRDEDAFRRELAVRGLGVLESLKPDAGGLEICLKNPCYPLILVGTVQGMYERLTGRESDVEWEVDSGGALRVVLRARGG
ncbi:hypothetical protein [Candidatus Solincola tengchongensis]|uniref:hypothetical protein n=1 Tax=Candidatus Solincola tengchongensis TaxID=2900693 RepID=UPI00257A8FF8|nr:hypothetical protein [Candidatus Solincola tengchongensis]